MKRKMLIESDAHETRVAILEEDQLTELILERRQHLGVVGNIYKGRVNRVLPGMQAAFVDIGLDRDAFLYVKEVVGSLPVDEVRSEGDAEETPLPPIEQLLRQGQELVVQVIKDALPNKGARISTQITLPGRALVLLPGTSHLAVSRRVEDEAERRRLLETLEELRPPGDGLIMRTFGATAERGELEADLIEISDRWRQIQQREKGAGAPTMLHRDLDLDLRVVRDLMSSGIEEIWVGDRATYERVTEFLANEALALEGGLHLHQGTLSLLESFGLDREIEAAMRSKVWLKSGGCIVIHETEALVAIDVNTSRYVGRSNLEETVLKTNLEAAREIVRQVRLRNLGGIIVVDLIDMDSPAHGQQVFDLLSSELAKDRAKNKLLDISEFGLVEITRKRRRPSLGRLLMTPCPHCSGAGRIKSASTVALELLREVLRRRSSLAGRDLVLRVHSDVASFIQREEKGILEDIEAALGSEVVLQGDRGLHHQRFEILGG